MTKAETMGKTFFYVSRIRAAWHALTCGAAYTDNIYTHGKREILRCTCGRMIG